MNFIKIAKIVVFSMVIMAAQGVEARKASSSEFNWDSLMDAITQVESEGNPRCVSGNQVGAMQITPGLVQECNSILKSRGIAKRYTLKDRFSISKSREMFKLIMSKYNKQNDIEHAIRIWNGGPRYKIKSTQRYYNKVMKELRKIEKA